MELGCAFSGWSVRSVLFNPRILIQSISEFEAFPYTSLASGVKVSVPGWSGHNSRYLSRLFLNDDSVPLNVLKGIGKLLKILTPKFLNESLFRFLICSFGPIILSTISFGPNLGSEFGFQLSPKDGTSPWSDFHIYSTLYLSFLL